MTFPIVEVTWLDANADHDERTALDFTGPVEVTTVGYLTAETEGHLSLSVEVLSQPGKTTFRCTTHIPKVCVLSRRKLDGSVSRGNRKTGPARRVRRRSAG